MSPINISRVATSPSGWIVSCLVVAFWIILAVFLLRAIYRRLRGHRDDE